MTWNAPITWTGNQVPTAALLNSQLRDNLLETMVGKATEEGQIFASAGVNTIAARTPGAARILTSQTTTSTTYTDLATAGPSVTVTHGTHAIVFHSCVVSNNTDYADSYQSFSRNGSDVGDIVCLRNDGVTANNGWSVGGVDISTNLTPGTTTWKTRYRVNTGTGTFSDRFIGVIPL